MTPLEHQVISLELAKQLKELGVKQESWQKWQNIATRGYRPFFVLVDSNAPKKKDDCSAFTVAELGEMLPTRCYKLEESDKKYQFGAWLSCDKHEDGGWIIGYGENGQNYIEVDASKDTEADARAKMLIYLLKNGLIKL